MRWFPYFILAYVALGLQMGLGDVVAWHGARPNLVLLVVLFICLHTPKDAALLGCFSLGLVQDFLTQHPPGLYAVSYGLVATVVAGTHQAIYRTHPLLHVVLALFGGVVTAIVLGLHSWWRPVPVVKMAADGIAGSGGELRGGIAPLFVSALYTALLAPVVLWGLNRFWKLFAYQGYYRRTRR